MGQPVSIGKEIKLLNTIFGFFQKFQNLVVIHVFMALLRIYFKNQSINILNMHQTVEQSDKGAIILSLENFGKSGIFT
jgi:hypothetical protein